MSLRSILCVFMLACPISGFTQIGGRQSDPPLFIDSVNEHVRARKAQEAREQAESKRTAEQESQKRASVERDFSAKREAAQAAIRNLPDTPEKQQRLDEFTCSFPPSAVLPLPPRVVEECNSLLSSLRQMKSDAAAKLKIEEAQAKIAEQKRRDEESLRSAQERKAQEEIKAKAAASAVAAEVAAREAALAESRSRILSGVIAVLGLLGLGTIVYSKRGQSWACLTSALIMGLFSGIILYAMIAIAVVGLRASFSGSLAATTFFGCWAISTYFLLKGATTASKVIARGFLIGAAEWFAMIPLGVIFSGKAVSDSVTKGPGSEAAQIGAVLGGGILASLTGFVSVAMVVTCLIGYAIAYFINREMKPESTALTKPCPECAETILAAARKCRYCGSVLVPQSEGTN